MTIYEIAKDHVSKNTPWSRGKVDQYHPVTIKGVLTAFRSSHVTCEVKIDVAVREDGSIRAVGHIDYSELSNSDRLRLQEWLYEYTSSIRHGLYSVNSDCSIMMVEDHDDAMAQGMAEAFTYKQDE